MARSGLRSRAVARFSRGLFKRQLRRPDSVDVWFAAKRRTPLVSADLVRDRNGTTVK
jgi:hypothetical protein